MNNLVNQILDNSAGIAKQINDYLSSPKFKSKTAQEQENDLQKLLSVSTEAVQVLESLKE